MKWKTLTVSGGIWAFNRDKIRVQRAVDVDGYKYTIIRCSYYGIRGVVHDPSGEVIIDINIEAGSRAFSTPLYWDSPHAKSSQKEDLKTMKGTLRLMVKGFLAFDPLNNPLGRVRWSSKTVQTGLLGRNTKANHATYRGLQLLVYLPRGDYVYVLIRNEADRELIHFYHDISEGADVVSTDRAPYPTAPWDGETKTHAWGRHSQLEAGDRRALRAGRRSAMRAAVALSSKKSHLSGGLPPGVFGTSPERIWAYGTPMCGKNGTVAKMAHISRPPWPRTG